MSITRAQLIGFSTSNNLRFGDSTTGCLITTGTDNFFGGAGAGRSTTTGAYNNFFGRNAGLANTTGCNNNFFGNSAGRCNTSASNNNFLGSYSGCSNTTGNNNNFIGASAGRANTTGSFNNFFSNNAGRFNTTGSNNAFIGQCAGCSNTTGCYNNFFGANAGFANTTGSYNNFLGVNAGCSNSIGCYNNFFGVNAGRYNTAGSNNNFLGVGAGCTNTTGSNNNFFGRSAGCTNISGSYNNFFGVQAGLVNTTGCNNTFIGNQAGFANTTGNYNNFFGRRAGFCNTTGLQNVFIGLNAGYFNNNGSNNNFLGYYAGGKNTTGSCNTFLGRYAGCSNTVGSNNVAIGNSAQLPSATGSCQLAIGSAGVNWLYGDSSARVLLGTTTSINNVWVGGASYQSPLQVIGNAAGYGNGLTSLNYSAGGYGATLTLGSSKNATVGVNSAVANGDDLGIINFVGNDGINFRSGAYIIATADGTTGTADLPTRLTFWTTADGAASPTERARFNSTGAFVLAGGTTTANGIGIAFPVTQSASTNANTLDDYEEGTWTASIATESGTAWTVTTQSSTYIKIGRMVFLHALINYTAKGSGQLSLVQSLPFTSTGEVTLYGYNYRTSDNTLRALLFTAYSNYGVLLKWIDSGSFVNYFTSTTEFAAAGAIYVAGCYLAAS